MVFVKILVGEHPATARTVAFVADQEAAQAAVRVLARNLGLTAGDDEPPEPWRSPDGPSEP